MIKENEKRHSQTEIDKAMPGVGARQEDQYPCPGGGGYQDNCTLLKFSAPEKKRDPRLDELADMGLQQVWLQVAQEIGVDNFLKIWRILDSDSSNIGDDGRILIALRGYGGYLRFQRNRYIEALTDQGLNPLQIKERLQKQLSEKISTRHISRIQKSR